MTSALFSAPLIDLPPGAMPRSVTAERATVDGRRALRVELTDDVTANGTPGVDYVDQPTFLQLPVTLRTGVIEVDVRSRLNGKTEVDSRAFAGLAFHITADATAFQSIYLRPLNGRKAAPPAPRDQRAIQYFAYPAWPFDRLRAERPDGPYESGADIGPDEWIRLRVEISEHHVAASVDGRPTLHIDDPLALPQLGAVGLFVDIGTEAFFADLVITGG